MRVVTGKTHRSKARQKFIISVGLTRWGGKVIGLAVYGPVWCRWFGVMPEIKEI